MSSQNINVMKTAESINSKVDCNDIIGNVESLVPVKSLHLSTRLREQIQPMSFHASAAEELTFQFSEAVAARESSLEMRFVQHNNKIDKKSVITKVEHIQDIMKLMEGKYGYEILRGQARAFANLFQKDAEAAIKHIDVSNMSSEKKYAILYMALDALKTTDKSRKAGTDLTKLIQHQNNPLTYHLSQLHAGATQSSPQDNQEESFYQFISMQPTIKTAWELIVENSTGNLLEAMKKTRVALVQNSNFILENIAAIVVIHKIMTIIQSMHADAKRIMERVGVQGLENGDILQKHTRMLIELAQSSMPSTLLDRIVDSLKSIKRRCPRCAAKYRVKCKDCDSRRGLCICSNGQACQCSDFRVHVLSLLFWHARQWPLEVWVNGEAKNTVLDQLLKKQNVPAGLFAKRMLNRFN